MLNYNFILTERAIEAVHSQLEKRNTPKTYLRLGIAGGGCVGMRFVIKFDDDKPTHKDIQFFFNGINVLIDKKSILYLNNCYLDYEVGVMKSGFVFKNFKAKSYCGCKESFSV